MKSLSSFSLSLISAAVLLANQPAWADEELAPVVVTATRTPDTAGIDSSNIQIISHKDIERSGAQNVADLLRQVAVVQFVDALGDGSSPTISMRGFGANGNENSLILLDGRRLNNDSDIAPPDLRYLSLEDIDHIEIINGSAGALFGSSAVGGVINIITKPTHPEVQLGTSVGSYDSSAYRLRAGTVLDGVSAQIIGEKNRTENDRDNAQLDRGFLEGKLAYDNERFGLYADGSTQVLNQNNPGSLFLAQVLQDPHQAANPTDFTDGASQRYNQGVRVTLTPNWNFVLDTSQRIDQVNAALTAFGSQTALKQDRSQNSFYPKLNGAFKLGENNSFKVVAGYDRNAADYNLLTGFGAQSDRQLINGIYTQVNWGLGKNFEVVAGGRHATYVADIQDSFTYINGVRVKDSKDLGSLGLYWHPVADVTSWLRADQNVRFPVTDEQTNVFSAANPLKTQQGWSYETGTEYHDQNLRASLQLYQLDLQHEISFDPTTFTNINLDNTRRRGGSALVNYHFTPTFSAGGQFAYVRAIFTDGPNEGKRIPFVARDNTTLNLTWLFIDHASLVFEQQRLSSRYADGDYSNSLPLLKPLYLSNVAATYTWQRLETSLRVNDLLNKRYYAYATAASNPADGFATDTAYMPAAGRNLLLSVDYKLF